MKTINHLIEQIVDLKIDIISLTNKNKNITNELNASKDIICNLKQEITNLRLILQESNNKEV